ncbi:MAG: phosphate ABC transporter permease subunit PstC [Coriobacteriales bacterium]|jgi:phosphate transport system permease protein|nr:phosphate ABC transporter permease subunit PstC [Coriobacteriales bacterium]
MLKQVISRTVLQEKVAQAVFIVAACCCILSVALICFFLLMGGIPGLAEIGVGEFLFGTAWQPSRGEYGIAYMVLGSLYVTAGALIIGVPLGLFCALYLSRFATARLGRFLQRGVELLAGIPSVVFGFFGLVVIVPFIRSSLGGTGFSVLAASLILGIMILPTIITVSRTALDSVPQQYYEGALALGARHERCVFRVLLPAAASGITAAVILGFGRAIGETMAVVMIVGNQVHLPASLVDGVRTLTGNIVLEMGYATDLHREALIATALVLFVFILLVNLLFNLMKRRAGI